MEVRPGYKQTEVGVIPTGWRVAFIEDIATVGRGRVISHRDIARAHNHQYPIYSSQTSNDGVMGHIDTFDFEGEYITWTTDGANAGTVFPRNGRFNCTNVCGTIKLRSDNHVFVARELARFAPRHVSRHLGNPKLMNDIMKRVKIPLPPTLAEQGAIAGALTDADALIESLEALITKKHLIKQGAMQELLTGKRRLPGFTGKWEVKRLGDLFAFSGGFTASRDQLTAEGYCYLHYGDIHKSNKTFIDVCGEYTDVPKLNVPLGRVETRSLLNDGDVVFVDASEDDDGASKHIVVINKDNIPFISGLHTIVAKGKADDLVHEYRRYCFQTSAIREQFLFYSVGTKVTGISKSNIAKLLLSLPSAGEQSAIAAVLSDMDEEIAALEARLGKARLIKQGMMQELLTGRIRLV